MQIQVRALYGQTLTFDVNPYTKVSSFIQLICDEGMWKDVGRVILMTKNKWITDNNQTLAFYNVEENSVIDMTLSAWRGLSF